MLFLDSFDLDTLLVALAIGLLVSIIIFLSITIGVSKYNENRFEELVKEASNGLRIYVVNLDKDSVYYVNRNNLKDRKYFSVTDFYNHFAENERDDLMSWMNSLVEKDVNAPSLKEIHVPSKARRRLYLSLLQVKKVDYKNRIVFLESYLLRTNAVKKKSSKKPAEKFATQESFNKSLLNNSTVKGMSYSFQFYKKRNKDEDISRLVFAQIKNIFLKYVTPNRQMIEYGDDQIVITNLKTTQRSSLMQEITILRNEINVFLVISSLQDQIGYKISALENRFFNKEPEKIVNTLASLNEFNDTNSSAVIWYEQGKDIASSSLDNETYRTEVERIIKDKKLKYFFRPIFDMDKMKIIGYQSFAEPQDSFFGSIKELKDYALRTDDDRTLFATIARHTITRFAQEKDGNELRLFFSINNSEANYVNRTLSHIQNIKSIHIVLVYNELEISESLTDNESALINEIKTFKSKGYEVALEINDKDLTLSSNLYGVFDFFLVDVNINFKANEKPVVEFRGLVEALLKYERPIIAANISSWDTIELMYKFGILLVASDVIAPKDENILPIPTKSLIKIKNITD